MRRAARPARERAPRSASALSSPALLFGLVALGLALRAGLVLSAEHGLDGDESVVGLMALDILDRGVRPLFFYGTAYNGGGALEAYLVAGAFALFGGSPVAVKLCVLLLWIPAALLFADLCRRALPDARGAAAVAFFCVGTPFFLEWSVKARGGFAETVLFSVALLWLARPRGPAARDGRRALGFGALAGLGLWASEMLLPLLPWAAAWLLVGSARRGRAALALGLGLALGLLPLAAVNWQLDGIHLRESTLYALLAGPPREPLTAAQWLRSWEFALGAAWPVLAALLALGAAHAAEKSARGRGGVGLVALVSAAAYALGFWLSGLRNLDGVPPSRVLYALHPSLALLVGCGAGSLAAGGARRRTLVLALACAWLVLTAVPVARWAASGAPREAGSWRSRWSLVDAPALRAWLLDRGVQVAYASLWAAAPLQLEDRLALRADPAAPSLEADYRLPKRRPASGRAVAVVLPEGSRLVRRVERVLRGRRVAFERSAWQRCTVFLGLDSSDVFQRIGLPATLVHGALPPRPEAFEGFN